MKLPGYSSGFWKIYNSSEKLDTQLIVQGIGIHTRLNNMCVRLFCDFIGFLEHVPFLSKTQHDGTETSISKKSH